MKLKELSIRTRFLILIICSVLFWLFIGFISISLIDTLEKFQGVSNQAGSLPQKILDLGNSTQFVYNHDIPSALFQESGRSQGIDRFSRTSLDINTLLMDLDNEPALSGNSSTQQKLLNLAEYLNSSNELMDAIVDKSRERGWRNYGLNGILIEQMESVNTGTLTFSAQSVQGLLAEARIYLDFPESGRLNSLLNRVKNMESVQAENTVNQVAGDMETFSGFLANLRRLLQLDLELGIARYEGLQRRISGVNDIMYEEANELAALVYSQQDSRIKNIKWGLIAIIILSASIYGFVLSLFSRMIRKGLHNIRESTSELVEGRFPEKILQKENTEFADISGQLNEFVISLKNKAEFAADLAEGKNPEPPTALSQHDSLANSLISLQENLQSARMDEERHQKSREERRWTNEGIAKFGEILRIYNDSISSLVENVVQELVDYLNASAGGIFLLNSEEETPVLELVASFAFNRKKYLQRKFGMGEGLVGTCAIEKEKIYLTEIPDDYINIASGLGESKPGSLLLMPLQLEDVTLGVIEIASLRVFSQFEIDFVENLAESIASAVSTVQMNVRTAQLLEQSQKQAREMSEQEEIMRQHVEELQATQEESARRESEISGILNGIHNSSHVAEFNMDEELISINDKFVQLLESQRTQILGKKFHEIIGISRHTDSYKQFWEELTEGKAVSRIDKVTVLTGHDIWLRQTFTPILDKDGNPFKVLNIAADITETVEQKESLEQQSNEIRRANIEMKSFSDAVDKALIKCVYSPAGQILELNENFEHATGFTEKEMIGKNNRIFLQRVEKEQFEKIWEDILKDKPYSGVIRRTKPTGEEVWLMSTFTPVKDENGNIFKVFFLGQDITERKLKYQLLEEANREIDRLHKQLDEQK